jgi:hypothetical protein
MNAKLLLLVTFIGTLLAASIVYSPDIADMQQDWQAYSTRSVNMLEDIEIR